MWTVVARYVVHFIMMISLYAKWIWNVNCCGKVPRPLYYDDFLVLDSILSCLENADLAIGSSIQISEFASCSLTYMMYSYRSSLWKRRLASASRIWALSRKACLLSASRCVAICVPFGSVALIKSSNLNLELPWAPVLGFWMPQLFMTTTLKQRHYNAGATLGISLYMIGKGANWAQKEYK